MRDSYSWQHNWERETAYLRFASVLMRANSRRWLGGIQRCLSASASVRPPKPNMAEKPNLIRRPIQLKLHTSTGWWWPRTGTEQCQCVEALGTPWHCHGKSTKALGTKDTAATQAFKTRGGKIYYKCRLHSKAVWHASFIKKVIP